MCGAPYESTTFLAIALTASVDSAASANVLSVFYALSLPPSRSVATTSAPSAMKVAAIAAPMPCPAAVMKARLPLGRPATSKSSLYSSMIVARHELLGDALIFDRRLEHHAVGELVDHAALNLLPRRLVRRIGEAAALLQVGAALIELRVAQQNVGAAFLQINARAVAALEEREAAARRRFRRGDEDRRRARRAGLAAVADAGQRSDALFDQRRRRLHVLDFRRARIADGARAAYDQHRGRGGAGGGGRGAGGV